MLCDTRPPRRKLARPTGLSITRHTSALPLSVRGCWRRPCRAAHKGTATGAAQQMAADSNAWGCDSCMTRPVMRLGDGDETELGELRSKSHRRSRVVTCASCAPR